MREELIIFRNFDTIFATLPGAQWTQGIVNGFVDNMSSASLLVKRASFSSMSWILTMIGFKRCLGTPVENWSADPDSPDFSCLFAVVFRFTAALHYDNDAAERWVNLSDKMVPW